MSKFSNQQSIPTPAKFEEQKKLVRQRELEAIQQAREKAKHYNATLRSILIHSRTNAPPFQPSIPSIPEGSSSPSKPVETSTLPPPTPTNTGTFIVLPEQQLMDRKFSDSLSESERVVPSRQTQARTTTTFTLGGEEEEEEVRRILSGESLGLDTGYFEMHDWIQEAKRLNRPSISDVLLKSSRGEHKTSITSVGPTFIGDPQDPSRLLPGVDVGVILRTFYSLYAPEKLADVDIVLRHFKNRTEALLFALECKYFVVITSEGLVVPYNPATCPNPVGEEDERMQARRATRAFTDVSEWTTDSFKGFGIEEEAGQSKRRGQESEFL